MSGVTLPVRAISGLLWVLVALGPLLGGAALLRPTPSAIDTQPTGVPLGVEGLAELTVLAHLSVMPGDTTPWVDPAQPALRLTGSALEGLTGEEQTAAGRALERGVGGVAAIHASPAGPGRWGITVAALRADRVEAWQVTVAMTPQGPLVETLPALVGLPSGGPAPVPAIPGLRPPDPQDPLATAVSRFLSALLTGEGELSRYLAVGASVAPPDVAGRSVQLQRLAARPLDDRRVSVLAEVRLIRDDGGVHLLHYPLLLHPSGGRWEVSRVLPALPLAAEATTTTRPSPPTDR